MGNPIAIGRSRDNESNVPRSSRRIGLAKAFVVCMALASMTSAELAAAQSAPAATAAPNPFQDQAQQLGANRCASLFGALGQIVTLGSNYAVQADVASRAPDAHAVQGVVGMTYNLPELKGQAAGVVVAVPNGETCEGNLVRVAPFQKSCQDVLSLLPSGSKPAGELSGLPLYDLGDQGRALLVSSGATCVVVTVARTIAGQ